MVSECNNGGGKPSDGQCALSVTSDVSPILGTGPNQPVLYKGGNGAIIFNANCNAIDSGTCEGGFPGFKFISILLIK